MKRFLSLTIVLLATIISFAQTQQGIVKTRGRMVDGQLVEGKRLADATITLNFGNPLVSGSEGAFSFSVPAAKTYSLVSATKQGYTLADPEYTRRSFTYSAQNPFYVVLEDEAQRQADINAARRNIQNTMTAQLKLKEKELEDLKQQKAIDEQEYERRIAELYDAQDKSYELVKAMAERYASTDYDQLDEFNRKVQMYIEEGELLRADSMIQSKGSIEKRIEEYYQIVAANKEGRERLEQSESGAAQFYVDLSHDLYNKAEIAKQQFEWNEALTLLKKRADLDTTNTEAVHEYAVLCFQQKNYSDCEKYYRLALDNYEQLFRENPDIYRANLAATQNNLGGLYSDIHDYVSSEKYYKSALENREQLFQKNPNVYRADLARTQSNLGLLYCHLHDYTNSEIYQKLSLENCEQLFRENPEAYRIDLARTQNNLGVLYCDLHDFANSEKYYKLALENYEQLFKANSDAYRADLGRSQINLGSLYYNLHDFANSEKYYKLALESYEQLFRVNPNAYRANLATAQNNLGNTYYALHDFANSEKYYKLALENYEQLFKANPDAYRANLAKTQIGLGNLYSVLHNYTSSEKYYTSALGNYEQLFQENPNVYRADLAMVHFNFGNLYYNLHNFANSDKYYRLALENYEQLFLENPNAYRAYLAKIQSDLGLLYVSINDFANGEKHYIYAAEHYEALFKQKPDLYRAEIAMVQYNLGNLYGREHKYELCEKYFIASQEHYEELLKQNPKYRANLALVQYNLGNLYGIINNHEICENYLKLALENFEQLYLINPNGFMANLTMTQSLLSYLYMHTKQFEYAMEMINKAIVLMPLEAKFHDTKGEILLMQGKTNEALEMWKKVLELNPNFLNDYPDGTELSNGLKKLGLIE